jgi:hypothetical protein
MLDHFMNQIGEMVLVRGQLAHVIADSRLRDAAQQVRRALEAQAHNSSVPPELQRLLEVIEDQSHRRGDSRELLARLLAPNL